MYLVLCAFEELKGNVSCGFTGESQVEEPISFEDDNDVDDNDVIDFDDNKYLEYTEVVVDDKDNEQYYYWVLTDDEDEAFEAALKKHIELDRPAAVNDEDAGVFPMAYQPVTETGSETAVRINADGSEIEKEEGG